MNDATLKNDDPFNESDLIDETASPSHVDGFVDDEEQHNEEQDTDQADSAEYEEDYEEGEPSKKDKIIGTLKKNWFYLLAGGFGLFIVVNLMSALNTAGAPQDAMQIVEAPAPHSQPVQNATPQGQSQSGLDFGANSNVTYPSTIKVNPAKGQQYADQSFESAPSRFGKVGLSEDEVRTLIAEELKAFFKNQDYVPAEKLNEAKNEFAEVVYAIDNRLKSVEDAQKDFVPIGVFNTLNSKTERLSKNLEDVLKSTNDTLKLLDGRILKIESMPIVSSLGRKKSTNNNITPLKTNYIRYKLVSAMNDKAWIKSKDGSLVPLEIGDSLKGYGEIIKITPNGHIETVSGRVRLTNG